MNETSIFETVTEYDIRRSLWGSTFHFRRYMDPLWIVIGLIGNLLALITWLQPKLIRSPSSIYLALISSSDIGFSLCFLVHYFAFSWDVLLVHGSASCHVFHLLFSFTQYFTLPLILTFSGERLLAILQPLSSRARSTRHKSVVISSCCAGLVLACAVVNSYIMGYNDITGRCEANPSMTQKFGWQSYLVAVEVLFSGLIPLSTLLVNLCVIRNLGCINETRRCMVAIEKTQHSKVYQGSFRGTTVVLVTVSMLMICCTLPVGVMYVCQHFFTRVNPYISIADTHADPQWQLFASYQMVKEIIDFVGVAHYSCNIFVYLAKGSAFKSCLRSVIFRGRQVKHRAEVVVYLSNT